MFATDLSEHPQKATTTVFFSCSKHFFLKTEKKSRLLVLETRNSFDISFFVLAKSFKKQCVLIENLELQIFFFSSMIIGYNDLT